MNGIKGEDRPEEYGDPDFEGYGIDLCGRCHRPTLIHQLGQLCTEPRCCDDRLNHYDHTPGNMRKVRAR